MAHLLVISVCFALSTFAQTPPATKLPVILVKGYGPTLFQMWTYQDFLVKDGFKRKDIHTLNYPQSAAPEDLRTAAQKDLKSILSKYPPEQRFDMITHSFGAFVGPWAAFPDIAEGRIRKFISLAGVTQGQDRIPFCKAGFCGETLPKLIPYRNPFVLRALDEMEKSLAPVEKCALFSPDDAVVHEPADSGALPGATAIEIKKATHNDFIWNESLYRLMRHACYGAPLPAEGIKFEWMKR
jgi:hypothetical protein